MSDDQTAPAAVKVTIHTADATVTVEAPDPLAAVTRTARREHAAASKRAAAAAAYRPAGFAR